MIQQEYFGYGSIKFLRDILQKEKSKNIFLVTGKESYEKSGAKKSIETIIDKSEVNFDRFDQFSPNPEYKEIFNGLQEFKKLKYDLIISIGGGSAIDIAKAIKLFYFNHRLRNVPIVAIPTTSGSGSEATYFIVYYMGKEKESKGKPDLTLPEYVILDPQFTLNLPKKITASTGMDALSQAVESYWSVNSNQESKKYAEKAITLIMENLKNNVNNPTRFSRENMLIAANFAGKAINISKTTACHAIAYPITSYFNIPHGHAVSLTLGEMVIYNSKCDQYDCEDKRGNEYVTETINEINKLLGARNPLDSKNILNDLMKQIGLETKLSELKIDRTGIETIIKNGFNPERVKNNPRLLTEEELRKILERIY
ncbi:Glycerol-1-phosphate dehydrogenase [NAD(P)+] [uncultured archaeon]|nr:Glycerol-1-phosphate dehydrogenase [NAD(P)+] [uncultured archaeon]